MLDGVSNFFRSVYGAPVLFCFWEQLRLARCLCSRQGLGKIARARIARDMLNTSHLSDFVALCSAKHLVSGIRPICPKNPPCFFRDPLVLGCFKVPLQGTNFVVRGGMDDADRYTQWRHPHAGISQLWLAVSYLDVRMYVELFNYIFRRPSLPPVRSILNSHSVHSNLSRLVGRKDRR